MVSRVLVGLFLLIPLMADNAAAVRNKDVVCVHPGTGEKTTLNPRHVQGELLYIEKYLRKENIHIMDLSESAWQGRRNLNEAQRAKDWCALSAISQRLLGEVDRIVVDSEFVVKKFTRVERWLRQGDWSTAKHRAAEVALKRSAEELSADRVAEANRELNRGIGLLIGTNDLWELPSDLFKEDASVYRSGSETVIEPYEVEAGCPELKARGPMYTAADRESTVGQLATLMDERKLRPFDLKNAEPVIEDFKSYYRLGAVWPALRSVCFLRRNFTELEIGLGTVSRRFAQVRLLRKDRPLAEASQERFTELVRAASRAIAERSYDKAHQMLDDALVILGAPEKPSDALKI